MRKQLTIGILLAMALLLVPLRAPAQACGMSMPAAQKMECRDCCATMKSCVLPQQNPVQPTVAVEQIQQSVVMIAPILRELLAPVIGAPSRSCKFSKAQPTAHSPPRLALLCTFLI